MNRVVLAAAALLIALPGASTGQEEPGDRLTLDLYLEMEGVGSPQISPDGRQIIYTRSWIDKINDRRESALWIMNVDGSKNRYLADGSGARWSPDGSRIAYMASGEPKGRQIFVRWMDAEGATTQITRVDETPGAIRWSPDGKSLAFTMIVASRDAWTVTRAPSSISSSTACLLQRDSRAWQVTLPSFLLPPVR